MLDREHLALMDMLAERNAFGRQIYSFEAQVEMQGIDGGPFQASFIRAPWIAEYGDAVEILARIDGHPIAARQEQMIAVAFHTELSGDDRLHRMFLGLVREQGG
jgi:5'-phosphate synthase pdxT subunit